MMMLNWETAKPKREVCLLTPCFGVAPPFYSDFITILLNCDREQLFSWFDFSISSTCPTWAQILLFHLHAVVGAVFIALLSTNKGKIRVGPETLVLVHISTFTQHKAKEFYFISMENSKKNVYVHTSGKKTRWSNCLETFDSCNICWFEDNISMSFDQETPFTPYKTLFIDQKFSNLLVLVLLWLF